MNLPLKYKIVIALGFGIYQTVINLFFDSKVFLKEDLNFFLFLGCVFISSFLIEFVFLYLIIKASKKLGKNKILLASSFQISGLIAGSLIWFLFNNSFSNYFVFVAAFIVSSFLPTVISLLLFLFKEAEEKI